MRHIVRVLAINLALSALVVAAAELALLADRLWPATLPLQLELIAWPLLILGILLILGAEYSLLSVSGATGAPGNPPGKLVTTGLYQWMRNPIYVGAALLLFSVAFFRSSPTLLVVAFTFLLVIQAVVVCVEEPRTERRLGADYVNYKHSVPRWFPRLPKRENKTHD